MIALANMITKMTELFASMTIGYIIIIMQSCMTAALNWCRIIIFIIISEMIRRNLYVPASYVVTFVQQLVSLCNCGTY